MYIVPHAQYIQADEYYVYLTLLRFGQLQGNNPACIKPSYETILRQTTLNICTDSTSHPYVLHARKM